MHSHVSCFTFLCLWRDFTDLNTVWHKSHIFSVSVSSLLTSSTTSIWRFSSSILISSSQSWHLPHLLYSQESQMTKQRLWQRWRVLGVEQMILILIVMDYGGHPFPMDVDGQVVTALMWQRWWWWGQGKPGDGVGSYWWQYPGTQGLRIQFKLLHL